MVLPFTLAPSQPPLPADDRLGRVRRSYIVDLNVEFASNNPTDLTVDDTYAIEQQVLNVVMTPLGSDEHEPLYGSQVPMLTFDPCNASTARSIRTTIMSAVKRWLSNRIADLAVVVSANADVESWTVLFSYYTPGLTRQRQTFRVILKKR